MGFWQGLNEGLTYVMEQRERKRVREQEIDLRKSEREEERAFAREQYQQQLKDSRLNSMFELALKRKAEAAESGDGDTTHYLSVLKGLGASDEVLTEVASYGATALAEATDSLLAAREKYAGSALELGPSQVDAFLSSGVSTVSGGGQPDFQHAASVLGLSPEDLDKPFAGGMTYEEMLAGALSTSPRRTTTWLGDPQGKPLEPSDINTLRDGINKGLEDTVTDRLVKISQDAAALRERQDNLTGEEIALQNELNTEITRLRDAQDALKRGSFGPAIEVVGAELIQNTLRNEPTAFNYSFGAAIDSQIKKFVFASEDELRAAAEQGLVKKGDMVMVNGRAGTVR